MNNSLPKQTETCNPCQFYGFFISIDDLFNEPEVIDIEHEDITNQKLIENDK